MKPKVKITSRGAALGSVALLLLLIGLALGEGELMTLGASGLMVFFGGRVIAPFNLRDLELSVELPPRFFAARSIQAHVELINRRKWLHARGLEIHMSFPHQVKCSAHAAWTRAQGTSVLKPKLSIPARAESSKVACEFLSRFPLSLFEARIATTVDCPALIYPQLITPPELLVDGSQADDNPFAGSVLGGLFGEPRGIRPYQSGDKATRIHQAATARSMARGRGLQVRAFDPPGHHPKACRIVFHSCAEEREVIRPDRFERGLSLAAGALAHFHANQSKVAFQADFADWSCRPCESRADYFECLTLLAKTQRAQHTKAHELEKALQQVPGDQQLIIISDSPSQNWHKLIPPAHAQAILINIREVRFKRRSMKLQASGSS